MPTVTVVVPVFNAAPRVPEIASRVLNLARCVGVQEVIVVDNASTDGTRARLRDALAEAPGSVRIESEVTPGIGAVRDAGARLALTEWVWFVDDDMELDTRSGASLDECLGRLPKDAAVLAPEVEVQLPAGSGDFLRSIRDCLQGQDFGGSPRRLNVEQNELPMGGGLLVRRELWLEHISGQLLLTGRTPDSSLGGEDYEAVGKLHRLGWSAYYEPRLRILHWVAANRLTLSSLCEQGVQNAISNAIMVRKGARYFGLAEIGAAFARLLKAHLHAVQRRDLRADARHRLLRANRLGTLLGLAPMAVIALYPKRYRFRSRRPAEHS